MNNQNFTSQNKVSEFVNKNPHHAIEVFNNLGIDFCCRGAKTLKLACEEKELDHKQVLNDLNAYSENSEEANKGDWTQLGLTELIDHIETTHHKYLKDNLPQLTEAMAKVVAAHGKNHPELIELEETIRYLREDLEPHMLKEEKALFPMVKSLHGDRENGMSLCGSVANPIRVMMTEHDNVATLLNKIHALTNSYSPPEDACETYKFLYKKLKEMEADIHLHVHKENNLLFPQALGKIA